MTADPPDIDSSPKQGEQMKAALAEVSRRFDEQLEKLQSTDLREKLDAVFEARGKLRNPPRAGETF